MGGVGGVGDGTGLNSVGHALLSGIGMPGAGGVNGGGLGGGGGGGGLLGGVGI